MRRRGRKASAAHPAYSSDRRVVRDSTHLCEHVDPGLTHPCICPRTWDHPFNELEQAPEVSPTLFELEDGGKRVG